MAFPVSVTFNKSLKASITPVNKAQVLQYIQKCILEDKADNIVVEDWHINYMGSTSDWRGSLFGSVDKGSFSLLHKNSGWFLNYQINMGKLFIGTGILSVIMGVFAGIGGGDWWVGIAAFTWLCGANWIINLIRHESVAAGIASGIDELIGGKELCIENDRDEGRPKSWF